MAVAVIAIALAGCSSTSSSGDDGDGRLEVATTTNVITDLARTIGGDRVDVTGLMGPGVDPHLYRASAGDVSTLRDADVIFFGGLELEGKMADLLEELGDSRPSVPVTQDIPEDQLLQPSQFAGLFDPHVWFSIPLWKTATATMADELSALDPEGAAAYRERADAYLAELDEVDEFARQRVSEIPERSRVLITSHDAFGYFGSTYGLEVEAIQGISTATEATTADIDRIAQVIADRELAAVFVESSVPRQTIEAVIAAAERKGQATRIGGELFSDSVGDEDTPEGTLIGAFRSNVDVIADGLS
jgi:manganese/zinc/iron transport system substrate-binding protein